MHIQSVYKNGFSMLFNTKTWLLSFILGKETWQDTTVALLTQFLYVTIHWKQWLLPTEDAQFVYWCLHGRADTATLLFWCAWICPTILMSIIQYTNCTAVLGSNHCFSRYWDIQELQHKFTHAIIFRLSLCLSLLTTDTDPLVLISVWTTKTQYLLAQFLT